ncbi:EF-hand domain-containing protein [Photobacterium sp. SDRW27]|uniref:EF-hand domain-containing protein n=1 Tax=Photobacterium obscurum TaxID=2829490 RepID=UPI002242CF97|nr:EF-hand domain-containing protein [Photobacterium obscurum]MCW8328722.1 EF-hand domain-containing protein [Photobacterium obscurum]
MMNSKITLVAAIGLCLISATSLAAMNKGMPFSSNMPQFNEIDQNQDETISPAEFEQFRQQRISERAAEGRMMKNLNQVNKFDVIDANHDNLIDAEEFSNHQANRRMANW